MKLFFDCETTGKALMRAPITHPEQPHIVQLAAILFEDEGTERGSLDAIIQPGGWTIPAEAAAIHGVTHEKATQCGTSLRHALALFGDFLSLSDLLIAHNIAFDALILDVALSRSEGSRLPVIKRFCTMEATTPICKLPGNYGFKWPKLSEAYTHLFGQPLTGAHNALADVRACARIYFEITKAKIP